MLCHVKTEYKGWIDITGQIIEVIEKAGEEEGSFAVYSLNPAAGVVMASKDEAVHEDILNDLERMFPPRVDYPSGSAPYEAAAGSRAAVAGENLNVIIHEGHPVLGCGQAIYLVDFLGKREIDYMIAFC